jgi:hypothetical protein
MKTERLGEQIQDIFLGLSKNEAEILFEKYILPLYTFIARRPNENTKWKMINRKTNKVYKNITSEKDLTFLLKN